MYKILYKKDDDFGTNADDDRSYDDRQINWQTVAAENKWAIASQVFVWKMTRSGFLADRILQQDLYVVCAASVFCNLIYE
jgi:hypothetical protein